MMRNIIALLVVLGMIGLAGASFVLPIPESDIAKVIITAYVTGGFVTIIGYFFGSSSGSKDKDDTLGKIALSNPTNSNGGTHP